MTREELLLALKDIGAPPEPAWWLPGNAQLILLALLGAGLMLLLGLRKRQRSRRLAVLAREELAGIRAAYARQPDSRRLAQELARWLKRIAMLAYPEQKLAAKTGADWLRFLDSSLGDRSFSDGCGKVFGGALYRPQASADPQQLLALCDRWLAAVQPRLLGQGSG